MMSISALSGGDHHYYLQLTNSNYYTESGEPPGRWYGLAAEEFGLSGLVEKVHLERLCNGFHHETKRRLVQNAGVREGDKARKPGDDMTFSADKTVSALFAVADDELRDAIRREHDRAVKAALDLAQDRAGFVRIGRDGQRLLPAPLLWSLFEHGTSRAGDPQLHTHALLLNLTVLEGGKSRTLDSTHLYHWQKALGAVYRAELARGMERLGFHVERVEDGSSVFFRVRGVPEGLTEFWSKRRAEIEAKLKLELGSLEAASGRAKEIATLDTRRKKELEKPRSEMVRGWREEAREFGLTPEYVRSIRAPYQKQTPEDIERHKGDVWREALGKLSYHHAYWSEAEMTKVVAERAAGSLSAAEARELIAHKIRSPELVAKGQLVTREKDSRANQYLDRVEEQFTTPQILALEKAMLERVMSMREKSPHVVDQANLEGVLRKYPTIEPEQQRAVEYLTSGGPIRMLSGTAGTGKGFTLQVCHDVWNREGRQVIGIADAGATAKRLEKDTGISSDTMAMTLIRLESGRLTLSPRSTVVVDEAGMLGTAPFAKLLEHVDRAGARVIFAGDADQLQPVQAGAPFKYVSDIVGETKLLEIRRQKEQWARDAVHDLKAGRSYEALAKFIEHGRFVLADTRKEAMQSLLQQWVKDGGVKTPERVLMVAGVNYEVRELNLLAQAERIRAGEVDPEKKLYANTVFFHVGDKVQFKHPSRYYDIVNSDTATVLQVDPERERLSVRLDRDSREVEINLRREAKRYSASHLRLAYAQTTHAAQGASVPHCHVLLGGPMADLHLGYVQGSRSRESTFLFLNKQEAGPELKDVIRSLARERQKKLAHEVFFPAREKSRVRGDERQGESPKPPRISPRDFPEIDRERQEPRRRREHEPRRDRGISRGM